MGLLVRYRSYTVDTKESTVPPRGGACLISVRAQENVVLYIRKVILIILLFYVHVELMYTSKLNRFKATLFQCNTLGRSLMEL